MTDRPAAVPHLAELDARFEAHLAALRRRVESAKAELTERFAAVRDDREPEGWSGDETPAQATRSDIPLLDAGDDIPNWDDPAAQP